MRNYRLIDNVVGFVCFAVAAFTYCSTIEPTASFWDCPEFISTGYKLEVGHPPGAPFFMLTANLFSQFTSDPSQVACAVNVMSALMSAGCILLLFWSITHLVRNLFINGSLLSTTAGEAGGKLLLQEKISRLTTAQVITIQLSGVVGALAYCWSDTFWFSAVEGEVYAYSSLFTALVFWLMLKWEDNADDPSSDRWLIFIAYLTGISVGVHLLNLLCLPALVLIFYYRKVEETRWWQTLLVLAGSGALVAGVLYGIVPGIVKVGGQFELLFVNGLGMDYNSGLFVYIVLLLSTVVWAIVETHRKSSKWRMQLSFMLAILLVGIPFMGYGVSAWVTAFFIAGFLLVGLQLCTNEGRLHLFGGGKHIINARVMNTTLLCLLMIIIGYSSYAIIVIRSEANPPMDQNSPEDIFTLGSYLNREQYGTHPLLWGPAYSSEPDLETDERGNVVGYKQTEPIPVYKRIEKTHVEQPDSYVVVREDKEYVYAQNMFFPRMYSTDDRHIRQYEYWAGGIEGHDVDYNVAGRTYKIKMPTQGENLTFFFRYQVGFMYWRYFLWNFAGRQNDIQGNGEVEHGNWISGIPFIDNARLGDQDLLPTELKENKGHNVFYCLPLILGLLGIAWQCSCGRHGVRQLNVVFWLFFMMGLAIVLYLNQTPLQPRERDYAYAGSFYAFAIWIGMGVAAVNAALQRVMKRENKWVSAAVGAACVCVPLQMVSQTWDDHDRSGRYTCRDFGQNYLQSLPQEGNPIIFTNGDNDSFPLWYNQDVEGVRTDARVCNLSYLQIDWYIDQMRRPAYDSPALPIPYGRVYYQEGKREVVIVRPHTLEAILNDSRYSDEAKRFMLGENPYELKTVLENWVFNPLLPDDAVCIPTDSLVLTVDKDAVRRSGMMLAGEELPVLDEEGNVIDFRCDEIPDRMVISLKGRQYVPKRLLMMLVMLSESNWERPLYVATTVGEDNYAPLADFLVQEGLVYRITPFNTTETKRMFDTEKVYDNLMNRFKFGGLDKPGLYIDETVMRMCWTHRRLFGQLAVQLMSDGDNERALEVVYRAMKEINGDNVPYTAMSGATYLGEVLMECGDYANGLDLLEQSCLNDIEYMRYYGSQPSRILTNKADARWRVYYANEALQIITRYAEDLSEEQYERFMLMVEQFNECVKLLQI